MDAEVEFITRGLQDAARPDLCLACLSLVVHDYMGDEQHYKDHVQTMRRDYHDLWNTVMRFMVDTYDVMQSVEHSAEADVRKALGDRLSGVVRGCGRQPQESSHSLYAREVLAGEDILIQLVTTLLRAVRFCLLEMPERRRATQRFSRNGFWPTTTDDLLPRGSHDTLRALLYYMDVVADRCIVDVVQCVFSICQPELVGCLLDDRLRHTLAKVFTERLATAIAKKGEPAMTPGLSPAAQVVALTDLMWTVCSAVAHVQPNTGALSTTVRCHTKVSLNTCPYFRDEDIVFVDAIESVLDDLEFLPETSRGRTTDRLAKIACFLHGMLDTGPLEMDVRVMDVEVVNAKRVVADAFQALYRTIIFMQSRRLCAWPDCGAHERDLGGRPLQYCGSCRIVRYCSRQCQRLHWKARRRAHKDVCSDLCVPLKTVCTNDRFSSDVPESEFVKACRRELTPKKAAQLFALLKAILLHEDSDDAVNTYASSMLTQHNMIANCTKPDFLFGAFFRHFGRTWFGDDASHFLYQIDFSIAGNDYLYSLVTTPPFDFEYLLDEEESDEELIPFDEALARFKKAV